MTREEEIEKAAWECFEKRCPSASKERIPDTDLLYYKVNQHLSVTLETFKEAVNWADENPKKKENCSVKLDPRNCEGGIWECLKNDLETEIQTLRAQLQVAREALEDIKEVQEALGGESVLLDDVSEALAQISELETNKEKKED